MKRILIATFGIVILSASAIFVLYAFSYKPLRYSGGFVRDFGRVEIVQKQVFDLKNSWRYIAGVSGNEIFIGNQLDSLRLLAIDTAFESSRYIDVTVAGGDESTASRSTSSGNSFVSPKLLGSFVEIDSPFFFVKSGQPAAAFRGSMGDWRAEFLSAIQPGSSATSVGSGVMVFMTIDTARKSDEKISRNTLYKVSAIGRIGAKSKMLDQELGSFASSKGMLLYSNDLKRLVYVYIHRNRYLVLDSTLSVVSEGHTIDTVKHVYMERMRLNEGSYSLSLGPAVLNKDARAYENLLFVHSDLMSSNERKKKFDHSAVIDVYDIRENAYKYSFYLPNYESNVMTSFRVLDGKIVAVFGRFLVLFTMDRKPRMDT